MEDYLFNLINLKGIEINTKIEPEFVVYKTIVWLEKAVIGLNLCPFAKSVHVKQQIRYVVSGACETESLIVDLIKELQYLASHAAQEVDTTLLIHSQVLNDFLEYNDFLELADRILEQQGFDGEFQIASFHPDYQFADSTGNAIENYTNRSPFPMLHLLRESSIDRAVEAFPDAADIYEKNMVTMRSLGKNGWQALFAEKNLPEN